MVAPRIRPFALALLAMALVLSSASSVLAQRELLTPLGARKTLVIDQLSGFRASTIGGVAYAGPIGFSVQSLSEDLPAPNGTTGGSITTHFTSFWLAPSADYFIIDHLSIGGLIEVSTTSRSQDTTLFGQTVSTTLPTITSITFLPRVGWMFGVTDRFGIWPRAGLGYTSRQQSALNAQTNNGTADTYSAFVIDLDVGFLYRMNENWFLRAAPELTFAPGSHSISVGNVSTSTSASFFQFAGVAGVGVMWDL